ncbi:MAG: flagellar hook-length control protein FliK [Bdellovibrionales bacterium]
MTSAKGAPTSGTPSPFAKMMGEAPTGAQMLPGQSMSPVLEAPVSGPPLPPTASAVPLAAVSPQVVDLRPEMDTANSLTRRAVWNDFLRKMKDEFDISAEDVLMAFSALSEEDLAKPPQQSVDQIVVALGLTGHDAAQAKRHFQELIQKTQSKSMGEELALSRKQISLTLMSQRELQRKALQSSLDQMNRSFFMNVADASGAGPRHQAQPAELSSPNVNIQNSLSPQLLEIPSEMNTLMRKMQPTATAERGEDKRTVDQLIAKFLNQPTAGLPATPATATSEGAAMVGMTPVAISAPAPAAVLGRAGDSSEPLPSQGSAESTTPFGMMVDTSAVEADGGLASMIAPAPSLDIQSQMFTVAPASQAVKHTREDFLSGADENEEISSEFTPVAAPLLSETSAGMKMHAGSTPTLQAHPVENSTPVTIPDLVGQAQVLVRDGGGDMKVTLNPEGLGEVAMKVSVEHGKVNVQMITESDEAKRLIERELVDLRSHLASNHLHVESIKVDTASQLSTQLEQQYRDAQRQMAQQDLAQFRQDHQGWRRSFFDIPSARQYRGQADATRDVQAPSQPRRTGARRLNLVA